MLTTRQILANHKAGLAGNLPNRLCAAESCPLLLLGAAYAPGESSACCSVTHAAASADVMRCSHFTKCAPLYSARAQLQGRLEATCLGRATRFNACQLG